MLTARLQRFRGGRAIPLLLIAAMAAVTLQQRLWPLGRMIGDRTRETLASAANHGFDSYPEFLSRVQASTKPGDRIALLFVSDAWEQGYAYGYYRASYLLPGREVLPLFDRNDAPVPMNAKGADYIAVFMRDIDVDPSRVVFSTPEGKLVRN